VTEPAARTLPDSPKAARSGASVLLVDTGPGAAAVGYGLSGGTIEFPGWQFLAGQFTLSDDANVTSVSGWMKVFLGGNIDVHIRADAAGMPGTDLHSQSYTLTTTDFAWYDFTNFNVSLPAGTYWVTFEPVINGGLVASMPNGVPSPLASYAFKAQFTLPNWSTSFSPNAPSMGYRVTGELITPTSMINDLESFILAAALPAGTTQSLNAKLNSALSAIAANQTGLACSYLQDVINFSNAQSGKKIPVATANDIISQTTAIRAELGC
jgi:hypothetical protein